MLQTFLLAFVSFLLGYLAFYSVKKLRKTEDQLKKQNSELEKRLYELSVSQVITNQIGYTLNIKTIIESIMETVEHVIEHSAVAYALVEGKTITCKVFEKDFVGPHFADGLKKAMLEDVYTVLPQADFQIIDVVQKEFGSKGGQYNNEKPVSLFVLPITINHACVGAIGVASTKEHAFSQEDRALLTRIIENTTTAVGNLEQVINTEKGKLDSFLFSLTSGAILFLMDKTDMRLSAINSAAKQFLHLGTNLDVTSVIAHFGMHYDLVKDIKEVATEKKSMLLKNIKIYDRYFKIYLNPVFLHDSQAVLGVSVTMEDVTFERDIEEIRETFTNMVVHELRAPLTSIKGASAMLLAGKLNVQDSSKMLHIVHDSTENMLMDIGDILDVAKLEAGKFTLNEAEGDINKVAADKVLTFSFMAQERHITIASHLDPALPKTMFDAQRIGQVFNNLISNALKFTPDNGTVTVSTALLDGQIEVSVRDTGQGVPPEKMALLFSKYGQLSNSVRKEGGTGLGLYISKGIIDSHNGKIWLNSEVGKGTVVSFRIPVVAAPIVNAVPSIAPVTVVPVSKVAPSRVMN